MRKYFIFYINFHFEKILFHFCAPKYTFSVQRFLESSVLITKGTTDKEILKWQIYEYLANTAVLFHDRVNKTSDVSIT
jgi:hypothetical protein